MKPRSEYPSEQSDKFLVRLPDGMRDRLKAVAEANNRSMNAEIVARLQESLDAPARIAAERIKAEEAFIQERHEALKRDSEAFQERMAHITAQLARLEEAMIERRISPKGAK